LYNETNARFLSFAVRGHAKLYFDWHTVYYNHAFRDSYIRENLDVIVGGQISVFPL
jgi:hypothetical protein